MKIAPGLGALGSRKPSPEIFHHTLRLLDASPERSLFVGDDYEADYEGARSVGLRPLLIDPRKEAPVPSAHRLQSILGLEERIPASAGRG